MPQLDLTWFLFNFLLAWSLILIVISLFTNQNWFSSNEENNIETNIHSTNQENKNWIW